MLLYLTISTLKSADEPAFAIVTYVRKVPFQNPDSDFAQESQSIPSPIYNDRNSVSVHVNAGVLGAYEGSFSGRARTKWRANPGGTCWLASADARMHASGGNEGAPRARRVPVCQGPDS